MLQAARYTGIAAITRIAGSVTDTHNIVARGNEGLADRLFSEV